MRQNQIFNQANIYISLWCLYYLQGTLYTSGSIVSQAILAILLLISLYNAYYLNLHYKLPLYFKGLNALVIMFTIYGVYLIISGDIIIKDYARVGNMTYLKTIYISLLPIYSAYLYTIKGKLTQSSVSKWFFIWLIIATAQYYFYQREALEQILTNKTEITNNAGYIFLALMPILVVFNKRPWIQFPILLYCMTFIFMGMKRGAIVIGILIFAYFIYQTYQTSSYRRKKYILLGASITIVVISFLVINMMSSNEYFSQRIEQTLEGDSSGRNKLYTRLFNHFLSEASVPVFLFGKGANGTLKILGKYAHNDWLEILINNGLLGSFVYALYWIYFIKAWRKLKKYYIISSALGMIFAITFMKTLFSMSYGNLEIYMSIAIGYFFAIPYKPKRINNDKNINYW